MKRLLSAILALAIVLSMAVVTATVHVHAETEADVWDGSTVADGYASGDGTEADPYIIETAAQLKYFADQVNAGAYGTESAIYVELGNDIDLGGNAWTPIGTVDLPLYVDLDGKGHTVSNFEVTDGENYFGFIGAAYGTIKNLTIDKATVSIDAKSVGGAAVFVAYAVTAQTLNIENCVVGEDSSIYVAPTTAATTRLGGFVGNTAGESIVNIDKCINYADITMEKAPKVESTIGGIVGIVRNGSVKNSVNFGAITINTATVNAYVGGVIGTVNSGTGFEAENCINYGDVEGEIFRVGGIVGFVSGSSADDAAISFTNMFSVAETLSSDTGKVGTVFGQLAKVSTLTNLNGYGAEGAATYAACPKATLNAINLDTVATASKEAIEALPEFEAILTNLGLKETESECQHTEEIIPGKAATCTESGLTEGKKCSVCGEILVAQEVIPVIDHAEETVPGKDATCTESGLTDGKKCSVCGEILVAQEVIPALGHTEEIIPGKAPTCTETGLTEGKKCSVCGETIVAQEVIPALGHTDEDLVDGKCDVCGADVAHTCTDHEVVIPGKDATCTETGLTEGKKCSICETITVAQEEIPALGHTEETVPGKDATCTETGLTEGKKCSVCGEILVAQEEIPALGHTEEIIPGKAPTCTETGLTEGKKCSVCGEILVAQEEIPALGHTEETVPGKAPTYTETGLTDGKKCSECEAILSEQEVIPALNTKVDVPATEDDSIKTEITIDEDGKITIAVEGTVKKGEEGGEEGYWISFIIKAPAGVNTDNAKVYCPGEIVKLFSELPKVEGDATSAIIYHKLSNPTAPVLFALAPADLAANEYGVDWDGDEALDLTVALDTTNATLEENGLRDENQDINADFVAGDKTIIYNVEITWGALEFTYTEGDKGSWNPDTLKYEGATEGGWTWAEGSNQIVIVNRSNAAVDVEIVITENGVDINADKTEFTIESADNGEGVDGAGVAKSETVTITVAEDAVITESGTIGNVKVIISAAE